MNIIIVGCGKVGQSLIEGLRDQGHDVSVISSNIDDFGNLPPGFDGFTTLGVPIDQDVLKRAGIESCDSFASVGADDNTNLMCAQIAKNIYNVPRVYARVNDTDKNEVFRSFGVDTVCPTNLTVAALLPMLTANSTESVTVTNAVHNGRLISVITMDIEKEHIGRRLTEISELLETNETIIAIEHKDGTTQMAAFSNPELKKGDKLILVKISI
ncbi:MAG: TrkA family potassium uptake protein [Ruminococcus sp.]|jgi:trk system potassium uptake protein TrkA|nr:TrkA family potassium uptake protein [Ruminococcus sp.]